MIRILTDSTAQFTKPVFPGHQLVDVFSLSTEFNDGNTSLDQEFKVQQLPPSVSDGGHPRLVQPSVEEFRQVFLDLAQTTHEIIAIFHSANLSPTAAIAREAAETLRGRVTIQLIDSLTTSVGLGYLVQSAAEAVQDGASLQDIERLIRGLIPHIYTVFCIPGLSYLHYAGFLGKAQAIVGEMLGIMPIFTLEEGTLTPMEKVRNPRHLLDFMQEFLDEFSDLDQIAVIQSVPNMAHEVKVLREHATLNFPDTPFSELPINLPLATLFGPRSIGVYAIENSLA